MNHVILNNIKRECEIYEESDIELIKVIRDRNDMIITFTVGLDSECILSTWEIRCHNYIKFSNRFDFNRTYCDKDIDIYTNHVLGWDLKCDRYELYFSRQPFDLQSFIGALFIAHQEITKGFIPFGKYISIGERYDFYDHFINIGNLHTKTGIFAAGPEPIMKEYFKVLKDYDMNPSIKLDNLYYQQLGKSKEYEILVLYKSYIIAEDFSCNRVQ